MNKIYLLFIVLSGCATQNPINDGNIEGNSNADMNIVDMRQSCGGSGIANPGDDFIARSGPPTDGGIDLMPVFDLGRGDCRQEIIPIDFGGYICFETACFGDCSSCVSGILFCVPDRGDPAPF